jgi:hypothetical protein
MKIYLKYTLLVLLLATIASCTRNNGDIGTLFGQWKVTSITCDDTPVAGYSGNIFFSFQSQVFKMNRVFDDIAAEDPRFASWDYATSGNTTNDIIINFSDNYDPYPVTGMAHGENRVTIVASSASSMTLAFTAPSGATYRYTLRKW